MCCCNTFITLYTKSTNTKKNTSINTNAIKVYQYNRIKNTVKSNQSLQNYNLIVYHYTASPASLFFLAHASNASTASVPLGHSVSRATQEEEATAAYVTGATRPPSALSLSAPPRQHQFILGTAASGDSLFPGWQVPKNVSLVAAIIAGWCSGYYTVHCWFVLYRTINIQTELTMCSNSVQQVDWCTFQVIKKIMSFSLSLSLSLSLYIYIFYILY